MTEPAVKIPDYTKIACYDEVRGDVHDGDLLLWRPVNAIGRLIAGATGTHISHASMAAWRGGRLYNLEMIQWAGGQHQPLSTQVAKWPHSCEVWRPQSDQFNGKGAVEAMLWLMGQRYGWGDFCRISVRTLLPKALIPQAIDSFDPDVPRVCSSSYAWAARTGGNETCCPGKPDLDVSPGDLVKSTFARYLFTLTPEPVR